MLWQTQARRMGGCPGRSLAAVLAFALMVSGCSGDGGGSANKEGAQPTASEGATEAETSTKKLGEESEPSAPTLPPKAMGDSVKAAEAFVEHYIDLFNYAMTTGDTKAFRAASRGCEGCDAYAALFEKQYRRGGSNQSEGWSVGNLSFAKGQNGLVALVSVASAKMRYKKSDKAKWIVYSSDKFPLRLFLDKDRPWRVSQLASGEL